VYGFMLLVFIILIIVTVCVTIVGTYFLLNAENYHWQWTSFFSAASTATYVYLYSIYYYFMKTKMSGFFQTTFYFGYTLMFCLGLGIMCGKCRSAGCVDFSEALLNKVCFQELELSASDGSFVACLSMGVSANTFAVKRRRGLLFSCKKVRDSKVLTTMQSQQDSLLPLQNHALLHDLSKQQVTACCLQQRVPGLMV
jgi:hypothetical protein